MELAIHGKQMDVGDTLRTHVKQKIEEISQKYFNHTTYASVTFSREGHGHQQTKVHITIQLGKNIMVVSDAIETDARVAFDGACEKAGKQLRRYKRRLRDHHARTERMTEDEFLRARDVVLAAESENEEHDAAEETAPVIVAEMAMNIQTMSVSEAVMRMDLSGQPALLFRNGNHGGLNLVYRRTDGNVGWVDPEHQVQQNQQKKSAKK
ncbi:MAG: ribosome-associated translation inhibitor RaiA [Alphaproteobacteria bacterium]|nr:ribosome-associated translation inhibitor RaiA [Alphaproteobacteria bacterium]